LDPDEPVDSVCKPHLASTNDAWDPVIAPERPPTDEDETAPPDLILIKANDCGPG
jgi:hypothetical protein